MKPTNTHTCQSEQIEAFLNGQLLDQQEQQFIAHLETCSTCRRHLDQAAAAPDSWTRTSAFLKDDEFDRTALSSTNDITNDINNEVDDNTAVLQPQLRQVLDALNPTDDPHMLGRLGTYEVSGIVGSGGMGIVLKALDRPLDRTVAIKVMAPYLASSGAARQRFSREARAAAAIIHPNVIAIYGVSTDAALPYLVMPYIGGTSLQKRLDTEGALPVADILRIGIQIASGLAAAHNQGLVHRDIKPANILLDQGVDRLVITDFGLARAVDDASVTRTGIIAGTPQYMSPEQARGDAVDARSDLFSLGSVLYTTCTGRVPFRAESPYGVLRRITDNAPRSIREINPLIPQWLCQVIERLHAKSPADRFQSANEVAQLLTECLAHLTQPNIHPLPPELQEQRPPTRLFSKRRTQAFAWIAVATITLTIAVTIAIAFLRPSTLATIVPMIDPASQTDPPAATTLKTTVSTEPPTLPWSSPDSASAWNDNLDPVLKHIEESLLQNSSNTANK